MKSILDLSVQVNLFHEPVNHSPLPWAGISYTLSMSLPNRLLAVLRKDLIRQVESAALSAVVRYYRRGIMHPTSIRLVIPYAGQARVLGVASHGPRTPPFWRRLRRLTPSGKRHETLFEKRRMPPTPTPQQSTPNRISSSRSHARPTYRM